MEPLGNLNKGFTVRNTRSLPFNVSCECTGKHKGFNFSLLSPFFPTNPHLNHEIHQEVAPPGLTYLDHRWKAIQMRGETEHKLSKRL